MRGAWRSISTAQMTPTAPPAVAAGHDDFLVLVNGWWAPLDFTIPVTRPAAGLAPGNRHVRPAATRPAAAASQQLRVGPRSVLELRGPPEALASAGRRGLRGHQDHAHFPPEGV